jgi:ABC-type branched-subunit amino acid transport system substrate-binding protein
MAPVADLRARFACSDRVSRRGFLRIAVSGMALLAARQARAEEMYTIGLILPAASPAASAIEQGATLGLEDANALATLFGKRLRIETETASSGDQAAARGASLARRAGAMALVGGAGPEVADALRDLSTQEPTVFVNVAAIDDRLRNERCARRTLHVVPSVSMCVDALAQWLVGRQSTRWTLTADEAPRAREIVAATRRAAARYSISLVGADESPQVVLMALEGAALAGTMVRRRAARTAPDLVGIGWENALELGAAPPVVGWIVAWHPDLEQFSGRELNTRFRRRFGTPMNELGWTAWAALKLIGEAVVRGQARDAAGVLAFAESSPPFDGHKGFPLTLRRWDQQLRQPLYVMGQRVPAGRTDGGGSLALLGSVPARDLDSVGTTASDSRCRLAP